MMIMGIIIIIVISGGGKVVFVSYLWLGWVQRQSSRVPHHHHIHQEIQEAASKIPSPS